MKTMHAREDETYGTRRLEINYKLSVCTLVEAIVQGEREEKKNAGEWE